MSNFCISTPTKRYRSLLTAGADYLNRYGRYRGLQNTTSPPLAMRLILRPSKRLNSSGMKIDLMTLTADFEQTGAMENAGGFGYLAECQKNTPRTGNLPTYVEELRKNSLGRRVMDVLNQGMNKLTAPGVLPLTDVIGSIQTEIGNIESSQETGTQHIMAGVTMSLNAIDAQLSGDIWKYKTMLGLADIDKAFGGFNNTDLIVIGGRPGTGKTMLHNVMSQSRYADKPVLFFSLKCHERSQSASATALASINLSCSESPDPDGRTKHGQSLAMR